MGTLYFPWLPKRDTPVIAASDVRSEFVRLWLHHPHQRRRDCREDHRLTAAALWMARDMRARDAAGTLAGDLHRDSLRRAANARVQAHGYALPGGWPDNDNWCESVAVADHRHYSVSYTVEMLFDSPGHHDHMAGVEWFSNQTRWGCAFVAPSFYALVTMPPGGG